MIRYDSLVQFYRSIDPNADRNFVEKNQSMRGSLRRVEEIQFLKSGAPADYQYFSLIIHNCEVL